MFAKKILYVLGGTLEHFEILMVWIKSPLQTSTSEGGLVRGLFFVVTQ